MSAYDLLKGCCREDLGYSEIDGLIRAGGRCKAAKRVVRVRRAVITASEAPL